MFTEGVCVSHHPTGPGGCHGQGQGEYQLAPYDMCYIALICMTYIVLSILLFVAAYIDEEREEGRENVCIYLGMLYRKRAVSMLSCSHTCKHSAYL